MTVADTGEGEISVGDFDSGVRHRRTQFQKRRGAVSHHASPVERLRLYYECKHSATITGGLSSAVGIIAIRNYLQEGKCFWDISATGFAAGVYFFVNIDVRFTSVLVFFEEK